MSIEHGPRPEQEPNAEELVERSAHWLSAQAEANEELLKQLKVNPIFEGDIRKVIESGLVDSMEREA